MSAETNADRPIEDLYDEAVSDGTTREADEPRDDRPAKVDSNASNYGGSAIDDRR